MPPTEIEEIHQYIYAGGKLLRETISDGTTTKTLDFTYDNVGMPYSLIYSDGTTTATYYYITNLQGDVMYLVDANGIQVAAYDYDPYGKVITSTGDLAEINPLRYRGYYYDSETGFYYLQSRYYDPEISRFINADSYASTGQGLIGCNMFVYCKNNPVNRIDPDGHDSYVWEWISTMWWMCFADLQLPIGDIIYAAGIAVLTIAYVDTLTQTPEPVIVLEENNEDSSSPQPPHIPSNSSGQNNNNKNNRDNKPGGKGNRSKGSLKRVTEYMLNKNGLDAHALKREYLGRNAQISRYDLFYDTKTGVIFILDKLGNIIYETYYNLFSNMRPW